MYHLQSRRIAYSAIAIRKGMNLLPEEKHVPYYRHFLVAPKTSSNRDQVMAKWPRENEGGRGRASCRSDLSRSPSLTGGPTSWVKPLPIQITLIDGFTPLAYIRTSLNQKNGRGFSRDEEDGSLSLSLRRSWDKKLRFGEKTERIMAETRKDLFVAKCDRMHYITRCNGVRLINR